MQHHTIDDALMGAPHSQPHAGHEPQRHTLGFELGRVNGRQLRDECRIETRRYYVRELEGEREELAARVDRLRGLADELSGEIMYDGHADAQRALRDAANLMAEARRKVSRAAELLPPAVL